jgi:A/G-specific adenine glycosylase
MSQIRKRILRWFKSNGRNYPWRRTSDPYEVLIAEMMLRRTTATAVLRVYPEFLVRYPDVGSLSHASHNEIEETIQTLGLQSQRASHLQRTAKLLVDKYDSKVSEALEYLESLPGVGRYVAAAVRNVAFSEPGPMVDGNIVHFLKRVFGIPLSGMDDTIGWELMKRLGGKTQHKDLYWGIFDLVALLCLRKEPRCTQCPLEKHCSFNSNRIT